MTKLQEYQNKYLGKYIEIEHNSYHYFLFNVNKIDKVCFYADGVIESYCDQLEIYCGQEVDFPDEDDKITIFNNKQELYERMLYVLDDMIDATFGIEVCK